MRLAGFVMIHALLAALGVAAMAQPAAVSKKRVLMLGEEKGYRHEAVSHAMATIERRVTRVDCGTPLFALIPKCSPRKSWNTTPRT